MIKKLKHIINHLLVGGTRYFDIRGFWIRIEMENAASFLNTLIA